MTSGRNLGLLKQFTDMHLKELTALIFDVPQFTCDLFLEMFSIEGKRHVNTTPVKVLRSQNSNHNSHEGAMFARSTF